MNSSILNTKEEFLKRKREDIIKNIPKNKEEENIQTKMMQLISIELDLIEKCKGGKTYGKRKCKKNRPS